MYCPECGTDAGEAKFCPQCGTDLGAVREELRRRGLARPAGGKRPAAGPAGGGAGGGAAGGRLSPALIWGAFAAVAVVVVIVVVWASGGLGGGATAASPTPAVTPVVADTAGSYRELVSRANTLYDEGDRAFRAGSFEQGAMYFRAAAQVYAAAWRQQPGDPAVGTDWAVSLFYSGDIDGAISRVSKVLAANPGFQKGWLNKGIFLSHAARIAEQQGDADVARRLYAQARQAFTRAVAIDPKSEAGQQADAALRELPRD